MPQKLPKGWVKTTLGEVCLPVATLQPEATPNAEFTYFDIGGIDNEYNRIVETKTVMGRDAPSRARQAVQTDDILFSTVRTYLKKIARIEREYPNPVASTGFAVIRAAPGVSSEFLFFQLLSEDFLKPLHALQTGTSYPAVRDSDVFAQPILLPPTREQDRIVAKLHASLSRVTTGEGVARRASNRLQHYRAAVLHAAVTGELTREWRKAHKPEETGAQLLQRLLNARRARWERAELQRRRATSKPSKDDKWKSRYPNPTPPSTKNLPPLPKAWTWATLDQLSFVVRGASPRPAGDPRYFGGRIPWITVGSITKDSKPYLTEVAESVTTAGKEASRFIEKDTLLLTNSGATLGVPKISRISGCINDGVAALLHVDYPLKLYLYYFLVSQTDRLRNINRGAAQPNLNTGIIRAIVAPVPPFEEQSRIISEVERRVAAADRLAAMLNRQLAGARATRQSLLREALAGRVVPQDPNDEPASILLDRIRAAREAEAKKPKGKRMPKSRSKFTRRPLLDVLREHKKPLTPEQLFRAAGFQPAQADLFYRELASLRKILREKKPSASEAKAWPHRSHVQLELKER
jgi:type I restriction enzyme S subunit